MPLRPGPKLYLVVGPNEVLPYSHPCSNSWSHNCDPGAWHVKVHLHCRSGTLSCIQRGNRILVMQVTSGKEDLPSSVQIAIVAVHGLSGFWMVFQGDSDVAAWWHIPLPDIPSEWHNSSFQILISATTDICNHTAILLQYSTNTDITGICVKCEKYQH